MLRDTLPTHPHSPWPGFRYAACNYKFTNNIWKNYNLCCKTCSLTLYLAWPKANLTLWRWSMLFFINLRSGCQWRMLPVGHLFTGKTTLLYHHRLIYLLFNIHSHLSFISQTPLFVAPLRQRNTPLFSIFFLKVRTWSMVGFNSSAILVNVIEGIAIIRDNRLLWASVKSRLLMASSISLGSSLVSLGFSYSSILLQFLLSGISVWDVWAVWDTVAQ